VTRCLYPPLIHPPPPSLPFFLFLSRGSHPLKAAKGLGDLQVTRYRPPKCWGYHAPNLKCRACPDTHSRCDTNPFAATRPPRTFEMVDMRMGNDSAVLRQGRSQRGPTPPPSPQSSTEYIFPRLDSRTSALSFCGPQCYAPVLRC